MRAEIRLSLALSDLMFGLTRRRAAKDPFRVAPLSPPLPRFRLLYFSVAMEGDASDAGERANDSNNLEGAHVKNPFHPGLLILDESCEQHSNHWQTLFFAHRWVV
jgi:hypothetical protein